MASFKRIIVAGPLVIEAVYPAPHPRDNDVVRQVKRNLSSAAQQRMNLKYAWQKLELEIAANFGVRDLYATLTYDDEHLPETRKEANAKVQAFWKRLRAARKAKGHDLKYIYVTEHKHGEGRWHHHVLVNATGEDYEEIRQLWGHGGVEFKQIHIDVDAEKTFESLARYLCKEQRDKIGQRLWSGSRTLVKPERECFRVPNDTPLDPPEAATVLTDTGDIATPYGHFRYIKYLAAGWTEAAKPRARRHRRSSVRS